MEEMYCKKKRLSREKLFIDINYIQLIHLSIVYSLLAVSKA